MNFHSSCLFLFTTTWLFVTCLRLNYKSANSNNVLHIPLLILFCLSCYVPSFQNLHLDSKIGSYKLEVTIVLDPDAETRKQKKLVKKIIFSFHHLHFLKCCISQLKVWIPFVRVKTHCSKAFWSVEIILHDTKSNAIRSNDSCLNEKMTLKKNNFFCQISGVFLLRGYPKAQFYYFFSTMLTEKYG